MNFRCPDLNLKINFSTGKNLFRSPLALLYNDKSVLENHHVSYLFRVMKDFPESNILGNLSRDDFMEFRQLVVDMILATDMSFHFSQLKVK